jgi:hypothetical protein
MPKPEKTKPPDDAEQSARFISTAKEVDAEKNSEEFERMVRVITPAKTSAKRSVKKKHKG